MLWRRESNDCNQADTTSGDGLESFTHEWSPDDCWWKTDEDDDEGDDGGGADWCRINTPNLSLISLALERLCNCKSLLSL